MPVVPEYGAQRVAPTPKSGYIPRTAQDIALQGPLPEIQAAKEVMDIGVQVAQKMREAEHVANVANANALVADEYSKFILEAQSNPDDYANHEKSYLTRMNDIKSNVLGEISDPNSKRIISQSLDQTISSSSLNVRKLAADQRIDKSVSLGLSSAQKFYDLGDADTANGIISGMMSTGLLSPQDGQRMIDAGTQQSKGLVANDAMRSWVNSGKDPLKFLSNNRNLGLTMQQRQEVENYGISYRSQVERQIEQQRRQTIDTNDRRYIYEYNNNNVDLTQLNNDIRDGLVTPSTAQSIIDSYKKKPEYDKQLNLQAYAEMQKYRYSTNPEERAKWNADNIILNSAALGSQYGKQVIDEYYSDIESDRNTYFKSQIGVYQDQVSALVMDKIGAKDGDKVTDLDLEDKNKYWSEMSQYYSYIDNLRRAGASDDDIITAAKDYANILSQQSVPSLWKRIERKFGMIAGLSLPEEYKDMSIIVKPTLNITTEDTLADIIKIEAPNKYNVSDAEVPISTQNKIVKFLGDNNIQPTRDIIIETYRQGSQ